MQAVRWPHDHASSVVEGWRFDQALGAQEVAPLAKSVGEPANVVSGSYRWIEWVLGREAAVRAARRAGIDQPVISIAPSGAPELEGSALHVSIAHTRGVVLAAVASDRIGIDVERADRDVSKLTQGLLPGEVDIATSVGIMGCLVAKEAAAKATGEGLGGSLSRWPILDAELSGSTPTVSVATPDGRIVASRLFSWMEFIVGMAVAPDKGAL